MLSRDHVDQSAGSGSCFVGIVFSPIRGIRQVVVEVLIVLEFRIGLRKSGDQACTVGGGAGLDVDVPVGAGKQFL